MKKNNKHDDSNVESLNVYEVEDECFSEGDIAVEKPIAAFNFDTNDNIVGSDGADQKEPFDLNTDSIPMTKLYKATPRGLTPPIDGEQYTVKRCYQFRPSTLRKLNELKAKHHDVNVYLNTILDEAILHYYNYIFNENGQ